MENMTPMLRQYLDIKSKYPGTLLFFRLGDFYEMFNEDAVIGARELEITLTARQKDSKNPVPMCGVPHHAAAGYISRLIKKGYRVAICEQAEPATKGTKLVKREVVRVITPGTAIDSQVTESKEPMFLCAVATVRNSVGAAFLDLSTGEFSATEFQGNDAWGQVRDLIRSFSPKEVIISEKEAEDLKRHLVFGYTGESGLLNEKRSGDGNILFTSYDAEVFDPGVAERNLKDHFKLASLSGAGFDQKDAATVAAGACLSYVRHTQKADADHVLSVNFFESNDFLLLDSVTLSNLEVVESRSNNRSGTLLGVIDHAVTGMGSRLLRSWILRPSIKRGEIETRLSAVDELSDTIFRDKIRFLLKSILDIERLVGKLNISSITPREILALHRSLEQTPVINEVLKDARSLLIQVLAENIHELPEIRDLISKAITEDPPVNIADGGVIREGFNEELDELRGLAGSVKRSIAGFEEKERERTGIPTLKIRFNNVFGYYIEVSKAQSSRVPDDYERKQTLANAERYTTPQLKEWEQKVLGAEERIIQIETTLFAEIRDKVRAETKLLQATARALATLDALAALAETAAVNNYVRPILHEGDEIEIKNARHPVVESFIGAAFVPNDIYLNNSTDRLLIVTGANMGGKSTVLRQIALIQIMAQIGSFVPAASARLPIVDRIFTRVGASDDLASGRSTFMVEMTETAAILNAATPRSIVLLDEIGRGTSTFDGLSIAWAVAEYLHDSPKHAAKTVFATHYHEMTELAEQLPGAKNFQMTATEKDGDVVFLHKLKKGKASKSYGIAVARLAGLPHDVVERAKEVLERLERYELAVFSEGNTSGLKAVAGRSAAAQTSLFTMANDALLDEIRNTEIKSISPEQAHELLQDIKQRMI
ncbi:MAG: DNA mismatch repair protein MutS [Acidobacteria bacterium]|nr:DNA mismatch repair protein MutS [Acidobacteriota bacterium]